MVQYAIKTLKKKHKISKTGHNIRQTQTKSRIKAMFRGGIHASPQVHVDLIPLLDTLHNITKILKLIQLPLIMLYFAAIK